MKKTILSFLFFLLFAGLINVLAQEGEENEDAFINPLFQSTGMNSFFDGQVISGSNWEWMHPTPSGSSMNWVQVLDANTWFVAGAGGTFQKTTDAGATWTVYKDIGGLSSTGFYRTIYDGHFFDANTGLLCGSSGTLIRTTDGGATWDSVGVGSTSTMYDLFFLNSTVGYVCGTSTIDVWKTTDAGLTWTSTGGAVSSTCYGIYAIDEDTLLCAGTSNDVRRSTDGGASWTNVDIGGPTQETLRHVEMSSATNGWVTGDDGSAAYTTDAGATWTFANTGLGTTPDYNDVDIVTSPPLGADDILVSTSTNITPVGPNPGISLDSVVVGAPLGIITDITITIDTLFHTWDSDLEFTMFSPSGTSSLFIDNVGGSGDNFIGTTLDDSAATPIGSGSPPFTGIFAPSNPIGAGVFIGDTLQGTWILQLEDFFAGDGGTLNMWTITFEFTPFGGGPTETVWATGDVFDMYFTTDMGTSWNPFSHLDPSQAWTGEFFSTDFISGSDAITVGTRGMMNTWVPPVDAGTALNTWIKSGTLWDIWAYSASGNVIAVGGPGISGTTFDQVMYSTDGGDSWALGVFNQPTGQDLNDISMVDSVLGYACGDEGSIYKTTDGGATWDSVSTPSVLELEEVFFLDDLLGYTFGDDDEAYKTTDGGITWSSLTVGFGTADILAGYFTNANTGWVVGTSGNIYKTTDGGTTWNSQTSGVTSFLRSIYMVDANLGYLCGSSSVVRKTTDGGTTWSAITLFTSTTLYDIEFDDADNGVIVGSSGRTFMTVDGGATWFFDNNSSSTLYGVSVEKMSIDTSAIYTCGSLAFIMRNAHVLVPVELASFTASVNGNNVTLNWQTATELNNLGFQVERKADEEEWVEVGFVNGNGTTTEIHSYTFTDRELTAGTYNFRIKQIDFDGTYEYFNLGQAVEVAIPDKFDLSQNYPNPFNPTTKITYSVPVDGFVNIAVYNVLGEKVTNIVNSLQKAGSYEVTFDATNFASGMYLYRMESGDFVSVKKMMILK